MSGYFLPLLWKGCVMRKRNYFRTLFELFLPICFTGLLIYLKSSNSAGDSHRSNGTFPITYSKREIFKLPLLDHSSINILFTPNNSETINIMNYVRTEFHTLKYKTFIGMDSEKEMIKRFEDEYANDTRSLGYGIVFNNIPKNDNSKFEYTIRNVRNNWFTGLKFPAFETPGPMNSEFNYLSNGFIALQVAINDAFLAYKNMSAPSFTVQEFPYPPYESNSEFAQFLTTVIPSFLIFSFIFIPINIIPRVIDEKSSGSREWMRMVGLSNINLWLSWVAFSALLFIPSTLVVTILLLCDFGSGTILYSPFFPIMWIIMLLFCISSVLMILVISTFFNNITMAAALGCFLWVAPANILSSFQNQHDFPFIAKLVSCLFPTMTIDWAFLAISGYEARRESLTFLNMFNTYGGENLMTVGVVIICQIVVALFYAILLFYFDAVKPGKFGRPRSWYFFIQPLIKRFQKSKSFVKTDMTHSSNVTFEKIEDIPVGLSIRGLQKNFGKFTAVNNVSIDIYRGQITALLGHNGAGKTTLINMLTGMYFPTDGAVIKDGKNVFDNFKVFQNKLGLCPQHNLLFSYLTVSEHVIFFGMMRGLSSSAARKECRELLSLFGLKEKAHVLTPTLSGGMKRKLCLAIALVGSPEIVILDEPTSGMDPESRRETWNKLLTLRGDRITLLTTHYMEEADVLGDMIAIMDHGIIKCYGSSMFLKKHFGEGYQLKVTFSEDYETFGNTIKKYVPDVTEKVLNDKTVVYSLPSHNISVFPQLFKHLENITGKGIVGFGVTVSTMDDVFLKVDQINSDETDNDLKELLLPEYDPVRGSQEALTPKALKGFSLLFSRILALLVKKCLYIIRTWKSNIFSCVIWPVLLAIMVMKITSLFILNENETAPALNLSLDFYGKTDVLVSTNESHSIDENYVKLVQSVGSVVNKVSNVTEALLNIAVENEVKFRYEYIVAADFISSVTNLLYSTIAYHGPPIAVNLFYNAFLDSHTKNSSEIVTVNHPFVFSTSVCHLDALSILSTIPAFFWIFFFPSIVATICASFSKLHHNERITSGKLLQFMTGTSPVIYWTTAFICDFLIYCFCTVLLVITIWIFDTPKLFATFKEYSELISLLLLAGLSGAWFSYLMSFFMEKYSSIYSTQILFCFFFGEIACFVLNILRTLKISPITTDIANVLHYFFMLYPNYSFCSMSFKLIKNLSLTAYIKKCELSFINPVDIYTWDEDGVNIEISYLASTWFLFFLIIMFTEYGITRKVFNSVYTLFIGEVSYFPSMQDEDVSREKLKVDGIINSIGDHSMKPIVIVDGIAKKYSRKMTAVKDVSFAVSKGECFGLLGVNGAGKSSTFKMLTGDIIPSKGNAYILGDSLLDNKLKYQSHIGYCPQFDAIVNSLTGMEMLKLYASLRGVNPSVRHTTISDWISEFGLQQICHKRCGDYSGGNKRKLSTAIALIGDPQVIFLDEPTTGVDPVARRKFWTVLSQLQKKGQTIIITSHSMDECEKVCDRLTIMAKGVMKCIGNIQHLKEQYGQGFTVMVKLSLHSDEELNRIKFSINETFSPYCVLRDEHIGLLHYHINNKNLKWSEMFSSLQLIKERHSCVEDYVISETSLEQIFLYFAKEGSSDDNVLA